MDQNTFTVHGSEGELRWGYMPAASLGSWTIAMAPGGLTLTAAVKSFDPYRTQQPSLTFRVVRQNASVWSWPVHEVHIAGNALTARIAQE